jgi:hypothetical protein
MEELKLEFIKNNKPKRILNLLNIVRPSYHCEDTVDVTYLTKGGISHILSFTYDELKEICSTLPHVPNKKEGKSKRQKLAKIKS